MDRPLCGCHSEPMLKNGREKNGTQKWRCPVKQAAWGFSRYHADPATTNYRRTRQRLKKRILVKLERIKELEAQIATKV